VLMALTEQEKRDAYLGWIEDYTGLSLADKDEDDWPGPVRIVLEKLMQADDHPSGVAAENIDDLSMTYFLDSIDPRLLQMLGNIRVLKW